jgi:DNA-binding NarL/FixJ family response regulator
MALALINKKKPGRSFFYDDYFHLVSCKHYPLAPSPTPHPAQISIAFAEDHALVRRGIVEYIRLFEGCNVVIQANDGLDLVAQIENAARLPDICILDIFMPRMNGYEALTKIKKRWPTVKTLILTGHNTDFYMQLMLQAGADGFLLKECEPEELETAIRSICSGDKHIPETVSYRFFRTVSIEKGILHQLTDMEIAVLKYCCSDMSYTQIAHQLNTTLRSVDWYRNSLFRKLNVGSRSGLVMYAIQFGLVELDIDVTNRSIVVKHH